VASLHWEQTKVLAQKEEVRMGAAKITGVATKAVLPKTKEEARMVAKEGSQATGHAQVVTLVFLHPRMNASNAVQQSQEEKGVEEEKVAEERMEANQVAIGEAIGIAQIVAPTCLHPRTHASSVVQQSLEVEEEVEEKAGNTKAAKRWSLS